nr:hypothetical protein HmN_000094200 [Hymenolepis microstoma]
MNVVLKSQAVKNEKIKRKLSFLPQRLHVPAKGASTSDQNVDLLFSQIHAQLLSNYGGLFRLVLLTKPSKIPFAASRVLVLKKIWFGVKTFVQVVSHFSRTLKGTRKGGIRMNRGLTNIEEAVEPHTLIPAYRGGHSCFVRSVNGLSSIFQKTIDVNDQFGQQLIHQGSSNS